MGRGGGGGAPQQQGESEQERQSRLRNENATIRANEEARRLQWNATNQNYLNQVSQQELELERRREQDAQARAAAATGTGRGGIYGVDEASQALEKTRQQYRPFEWNFGKIDAFDSRERQANDQLMERYAQQEKQMAAEVAAQQQEARDRAKRLESLEGQITNAKQAPPKSPEASKEMPGGLIGFSKMAKTTKTPPIPNSNALGSGLSGGGMAVQVAPGGKIPVLGKFDTKQQSNRI